MTGESAPEQQAPSTPPSKTKLSHKKPKTVSEQNSKPAAASHSDAGASSKPLKASKQKEGLRLQRKHFEFVCDVLFVLLFLLLGLWSRFHLLAHPNEVVFDETHFCGFINNYIKGEYFFDIHPPTAKLIMAGIGHWYGYQGDLNCSDIGNMFKNDHYIELRFMPALCGALLVPFMYLAARAAGASPLVAAVGGAFGLLECGFVAESRYILTDGFLFLFDLLSIYTSLKSSQYFPLSFKWVLWMLACGFSMGLSLSVKFTAIGIVGTVGVHQLIMLFREHDRPWFVIMFDMYVRAVLLLLPVFIIVFGSFTIHLAVLPYNGPGNDFMSDEFRENLRNKDDLPGILMLRRNRKRLLPSLYEMIATMHESNVGLRADHPFSSTWDEWPIGRCTQVLYWDRVAPDATMRTYMVSNPVVLGATFVVGVIGALAIFGLFVSHAIVSEVRDAIKGTHNSQPSEFFAALIDQIRVNGDTLLTLLIGYFANWVPYFMIKRATWNYHYLPAVIFAILLYVMVLEIFCRMAQRYDKWALLFIRSIAGVLLIGSTWAFMFLAPWVYGFPQQDSVFQSSFLYEMWRAEVKD